MKSLQLRKILSGIREGSGLIRFTCVILKTCREPNCEVRVDDLVGYLEQVERDLTRHGTKSRSFQGRLLREKVLGFADVTAEVISSRKCTDDLPREHRNLCAAWRRDGKHTVAVCLRR